MTNNYCMSLLLKLAMFLASIVRAKKEHDEHDNERAYTTAAPVVHGKTSRLLINLFDEADGLLFDTNTIVTIVLVGTAWVTALASGPAWAEASEQLLRAKPTTESRWNPLTWQWVPTQEEMLKYRQGWNPMSNGPILLTGVDINPKGQFHMQIFGFGETSHQQFGNQLSTQGTNSPIHLNAFEPLVVMGYGLTDHIEFNAAFSAIYWNANDLTASGGRQSTSDIGIGDTAFYLKYRPVVQDPGGWRPSVTLYSQVTVPTSTYLGTSPIPGNFSPLGKLPASPFGGLEFTEGVLFRKNIKPFRISGGVFYTYTTPGHSGVVTSYQPDIVNTRLVFEHILDESKGFGYNLEFISIHSVPFRADGHALNINPSNFQLFGIEPAVQYRFSDHLVGAGGVLFTIAGQNNLDAIYPNFSLYYYWDKKGGATMR